MEDFYDIHCHILYGVDDGSHSVNQSARMLDIAYGEGFRTIILTPHYNRRFHFDDTEELQNRFDTLCGKVEKHYPGMRLLRGNEIYYTEDTIEQLRLGQASTMAGGRYVLLEFAPYVEFSRVKFAVNELVQHGYIPIIAHVERYDCFLHRPEDVEVLAEMGAYIQINADSVIGKNGRQTKKVVRKLLDRQQVHFVATDCHGDTHRAPYMRKCADYIEKKYGHEYAEKIFHKNPQCIIDNEYIEDEETV
ncbi:MAG: CpsB/CapC family capsule biosynthesis tyrosine phosphatase [Wujia sp.]